MVFADLNHYQLLGVEQNATTIAIRAAYRKMSLSLHPDKNPNGANLMKNINAAWEILSDDTQRRKYDREISIGGGRTTNRYSQYDNYDYEYYEARISFLEQQLRSSKSQNQELRYQLNDSNKALNVARAHSKSSGKKLKQLEAKHKQSEAQCKQLNKSVNYYKSENDGLQKSLDKAHDENWDLQDKMDLYEKEKKKAVKALKNEKQKFEDILAAEKEKATEQMELMKEEMLARSICYTCNGEGGNDCITCEGQGSIQGNWTRCHNCKGTGTLTSLYGEGKTVECLSCFGRGAKEGVFQIPCFKCKGDRKKMINCNSCHKGKLRGFSLKPCPFCKGNGCMNCLGEGCVLFGYLCNGNRVPPSPSSLQTVLKKEAKKVDGWLDRFMESANSNYTCYTSEFEECKAFVSLIHYEHDEVLKPSAGVDEAKDTFAKFNINSNQVSFSIGFSKRGRPGDNRKGNKKERASGQRKSSASSPTSVLFASNAKADTKIEPV